MADYNSEYTGQQIDDAVERLITSADNWDGAITAAQEAASEAQTAINAAAAAYEYINTDFAKVNSFGLIEHNNARVVYLDAMVGIDSGANLADLPDGITYYRDGTIRQKNGSVHGSIVPNIHTIYISKKTLKNYKWTGSSMQEIQGSGHGFDSAIYTAIKNNMSLLQERLDRLIADLAIMAFQSTATGYKTGVGELTWPDVTQTPLLNIKFNGGIVNGTTVEVIANAGGSTTISFIVKVENIDTGDDFVAELSGGTSLTLVSNTISFAQAKSSNGATLNIIYSQTGETSTTLTVRGNDLIATVPIHIAEAGSVMYNVTGSLYGCTINGETEISESVGSGNSWTGTLVPDSGYTLPDIDDDIITIGTAESVSLVGSTLTIAHITSDIVFLIRATSNQQVTDYVSDGLVLHLDGKNKGQVENSWVDTKGDKVFTLVGDPVIEDDGITFSTDGVDQYGYYYNNRTPNWPCATCTIEICFTPHKNFIVAETGSTKAAFFGSRKEKAIAATFYKGFGFAAVGYNANAQSDDHSFKRALKDNEAIISGSPVTLSMNLRRTMLNGVVNDSGLIATMMGIISPYNADLMVGGTTRSNYSPAFLGCDATIHEVRIYDRLLDADEMKKNQQYDNIKYNLELQI